MLSSRHSDPPDRGVWLRIAQRALAGLLFAASVGQAHPLVEPDEGADLALLQLIAEAALGSRYADVIGTIEAQSTVVLLPVEVAFNDVPAARLQLASNVALAGGDGSIAVVYPDIGEPYRSVFSKIIEGIEARAGAQVYSYAVGAGTDALGLRRNLKAKDVKVVIALGRQGLQAADRLDSEFGVVVGGVVAVPEDDARDRAVISLSPDPALLFARLKSLAPAARRVNVVYDPRQNDWLIRLAREAARNHGLELVAQEARDLKTAVTLYQSILADADPQRDVLWLPQDATTVDEGVVLPLVLREAWENRLPVFSSSFGHVKRGVLFSLYPDNVGLGRKLAGSAMSYLSTGEPASRGVSPLKDVQTAVNLRTAKHLGLSISSQQQRGFDLVFTGQ
jgi:putative ABC transport system substrate-binding protein